MVIGISVILNSFFEALIRISVDIPIPDSVGEISLNTFFAYALKPLWESVILEPVTTLVNPVIVFIPIFLYVGKFLVLPRNLEPITISALFSEMGFNIESISEIWCCPSASNVTKTSPSIFLASLKIVFIAEPYPIFFSCLTTLAPIDEAMAEVISEEPSSHTMIFSYFCFNFATIEPIFFSSLNAGIPIITFKLR